MAHSTHQGAGTHSHDDSNVPPLAPLENPPGIKISSSSESSIYSSSVHASRGKCLDPVTDTSLVVPASPPPANGTPVSGVESPATSPVGTPFVERSNPMGSGNAQTVSSKDPKAVAQAATDMKNVVRRKLTGYVGFANLPNQWHRKSVRKGFNFNVMVVGEST